jgi:hypothetical protein
VSSLLSPNIIFGTLFSSILSLCSSIIVRDQGLYPTQLQVKL